eukprot:Plantae.Rhodophyta-Purpureofilum_apyrenoidigerum.ctg16347.p1 GENE.Plantae.Rhodophyta-Purpureofilum_apyrenoidigerum.ctg16347~~Plantae.Rhodophyta-Purpureofilum_apyrenoidigerum.ctg16347.p1  ORF type:complete len:468 (+),score=34.70 Plantae.Rhodophyta-Purpureofilum_apyrenoidigerum.ctg16347:122-1525(+)
MDTNVKRAQAVRGLVCAASIIGCYRARKAVGVLVGRLKDPIPLLEKGVRAVIVIAVLQRLEKFIGKAIAPAPGSLGGMILLSVVLIAFEISGTRSGKRLSKQVMSFCRPASSILAKWMPLFFAPPLVSLPLALTSIKSTEAPRALFAHVLLFFLTCASTALITSIVPRRRQPQRANHTETDQRAIPESASAEEARQRAKKPAGEALFLTCLSSAVLSAVSLFVRDRNVDDALLVAITACSYVIGQSSESLKKALHPVVICGAVTCIITWVLGGGSASLLQYAARPGALYMGFLGTSLFALGFKMAETKAVLFENALPILVGSGWAAIFSLYGTAIVTRLLGVNKVLAGAFLGRSLTTPLAISVARILKSNVSLTVGAVVLSGLLGANFGKMFLKMLGIKKSNSAARGVALGASAHGLGTAALAVDEGEASSTAAVSFALTGTIATILVSIAPLRKLLLRISAIEPVV